MQIRWFIVDLRYLPISVKHEGPDIEELDGQHAWVSDLTPRPLFTLHIASVWNSFPRCVNFVILCTSFVGFQYQSGVLETDDTRIYPCPNAPSTLTCAIYFYEVLYRLMGNQIQRLKMDLHRLYGYFFTKPTLSL